MKHVAPPIGVAQTPRGLRIALPPRFWLLVSLRAAVRKLLPDEAAWTYLAPATTALRVEQWIAEVEIQLAAERRRRAWSVSDAEWEGVAAASAPIAAMPAPEPVVVRLPTPATTRGTLQLLEQLRDGQVLVASVAAEAGAPRSFILLPSGASVRAAVARRAIAEQLVRPACDGLFGPETSQSWDLPPVTITEETDRAVTVLSRPLAKLRQRPGSRPSHGGGHG